MSLEIVKKAQSDKISLVSSNSVVAKVVFRKVTRAVKNTLAIASTAFALGLLFTTPALATDHNMAGHISIIPSEIQWVDAPSMGPNVKLAILEGDPKLAQPFTFRVKFPPNFKVAPHTHPVYERVTVIAGTFSLGIGAKFDASKARAFPTGGVAIMPPGMPMFAYASNEETIIQIHGTGPWGITYINPEDNPSKK